MRDIVSEDGISALVSSHLLEDIEFLCDRVAFLNEGRLLAHDHIKELTAHQEDALMVRYQGDTESFVAALRAEKLAVRETGPEMLEVGGIKDALPVFRAARQSATRVRGCRAPERLARELVPGDRVESRWLAWPRIARARAPARRTARPPGRPAAP